MSASCRTLVGWTGGGSCSRWSSPLWRRSGGAAAPPTRRPNEPSAPDAPADAPSPPDDPGHRLGRTGASAVRPRRLTPRSSRVCRWTVRYRRPSSGSGPSTLTTPRPSFTPACTSWCSAAFRPGHPPLARRTHCSRRLRRQHRRAVPGDRNGQLRASGHGHAPRRRPARRIRPGGGRNPPGVPVEPRPAAGRRRRWAGPAGLKHLAQPPAWPGSGTRPPRTRRAGPRGRRRQRGRAGPPSGAHFSTSTSGPARSSVTSRPRVGVPAAVGPEGGERRCQVGGEPSERLLVARQQVDHPVRELRHLLEPGREPVDDGEAPGPPRRRWQERAAAASTNGPSNVTWACANVGSDERYAAS